MLKQFIKLVILICSLIFIGSPIKLQQNMNISSSYKNTNLEFSSDFSLTQGNKLHSTFSTKCYNNHYFLHLTGTNYQPKRLENTIKNNNLDSLMSTTGITILFKTIYAYNCNYYLL